MELDPILLARLQFAFTIIFHIIFPTFTIGLSAYIATLCVMWMRTGKERYRLLARFWTKIFAVSFAMGVVSGIVLSYQFGTNWSRFSAVLGNVIGPMIGYEVLVAFFLEATFLGVMLFGWDRVPPWLHTLAAVVVAIGTTLSAFWILSANSWMQTPAGYEMRDGVAYPLDWLAIVFNPSFGGGGSSVGETRIEDDGEPVKRIGNAITHLVSRRRLHATVGGQNPERRKASWIATTTAASVCSQERFQPRAQRRRNVASRKKATRTS